MGLKRHGRGIQSKCDGTTITLSNSDKWMKQAGVIDGKNITTTDTGICFNKFKSKTLTYENFVTYVETLAKEKSVDPGDLRSKLMKCAVPGMAAGSTKPETSGAVARLTDVSRYTGTHRERFDASGKGKGKGIEGRENRQDTYGFVTAYKDKDTYDKKH